MSNFAIIIFSQDDIRSNDNKILNIFMKVKDVLTQQNKKIAYEKIKVVEDGDLYILKLPFSYEQINNDPQKNRNKKIKLIEDFCEKHEIIKCFVPQNARELFEENSIFSVLSGYLYKLLFREIIKDIYKKNDMVIREHNVTIVSGKSEEEVLDCIYYLSNFSKFITVVVDEKNKFEILADEIYEKTGLSVVITDNVRTAFKNSDLVINYGELNFKKVTMKPKSIIINYGKKRIDKISEKCVIINGICIKLPSSVKDILNKDLEKYYTSVEIAEAFIETRFSAHNICIKNLAQKDQILEEITGLGYKIDKVVCRRNSFKLFEIFKDCKA